MPTIDLNTLRDAFENQPVGGTGEPLPDGSKRTVTIQVKLIEGEEVTAKSGKEYIRMEVTYKDVARQQTASKKVAMFDREQAGVVLSMEPGKEYDVEMEKRNGYWNWIAATEVPQQSPQKA